MEAVSGEYGSEEVKRAQLQSVLSNLPVSLAANCFIASSAALLIYDERRGGLVFAWLAGTVILNVLRMIYGLKQLRMASHLAPGKALRNLTILAFIAGASWAPLPIYFLDTIESRTSAYIVFIMAGITTGAIIQSLAYWRISVAFGGPILLSTIIKLLMQGHTVDLVVASNVFLLMAMLIRSAIMSEAKFRINHTTTLQATELAASLQHANEEVQKANETLKRLATTDPLTGLPNRSVFNQMLAGLIHAGAPVSLALVDIDQFKAVNDNEGHAAGDQILCSLALFMLDNASEGLTPIRLGGDEFAIIASGPECATRLMHYAITLQRNMKTLRNPAGDMNNVTLSVGICVDEGKQLSASELFADADRALYAAKAAGRNCIRIAKGQTETLPKSA
ncbi:GGDEF domain-containing protein [Rhizobium sp. C4]|uniref:GGDEF domain-containing protein n=1 Tax=Rhizobium sp. C4 TaxID=1349800 RepID=UPI001E4D3216|nr:GGDEF domain-containing protein [Rhizobium sp. C4]MCD2173514.1 GGDEF domain-containing protein [Rhizobium sp. C4]